MKKSLTIYLSHFVLHLKRYVLLTQYFFISVNILCLQAEYVLTNNNLLLWMGKGIVYICKIVLQTYIPTRVTTSRWNTRNQDIAMYNKYVYNLYCNLTFVLYSKLKITYIGSILVLWAAIELRYHLGKNIWHSNHKHLNIKPSKHKLNMKHNFYVFIWNEKTFGIQNQTNTHLNISLKLCMPFMVDLLICNKYWYRANFGA